MNLVQTEFFENEDWLKDLFDNAHDLIHILHLDGTIIYVNKSWSQLLGYTLEEIYAQSIYKFIDTKHQEKYLQYRNDIIEGKEDKRIVFDLVKKDGHVVSVEGHISAKYIDGAPVYTRGMFRDISEQLQQEAQLQQYYNELEEKEKNMQQLLLHAPDPVVVIDKESNITYWNPKAEALFGWQKEEVLLQPLSNFIIPQPHREAHKKGMERYLQTGNAHVLNKTVEITALKKSGEEFYVALTISQTMQHGAVAFIAFIRDITAQKNNLQELERKTKELERSNNDLEEFAYAASHDLKEPVRKVHLFADKLRSELEDSLTGLQRNLFERMQRATLRMGTLIDDLLDYSHVSKGISGFELIDLNKKVQIVLEDLEVEIQEKNAVISVGPLPKIWGNRRQMLQLFQNLLGNALKYGKPNVPPQVSITHQIINEKELGRLPVSEKGFQNFHLIEIKDNGIGFEPGNAELIFNVFTRLHSNAEYEGTGVGLSIARKVAENHGGTIWAEGQPNQGASFFILLPVQELF